jgi:nitrate reductase gamma subunit
MYYKTNEGVLRRLLKITVFWEVMPYNLVDIYCHFGGTRCFHLQCWRSKQQDSLKCNWISGIVYCIAAHTMVFFCRWKFLCVQKLDITCLLLLLVHYCFLFVPVSVFNPLAGFVILFLAHFSVAGICAVYLTHM